MSGKKVLFVEDNDNVRGVIDECLKVLDYDPTIAIDFQTACTAYETMQENGGPDIFLTDWRYPDGGGEALITYLRHEKKYTGPIGILTAEPKDVQDAGFGGYPRETKPITLETLKAFMTQLESQLE